MITTKYDGIMFESRDISNDIKRLINQIWKLIPMKENQENWERQIDLVIVELLGLQEIFQNRIYLLRILSELEGLKKHTELEFIEFRSIVFSIISLVSEENERFI